jgi:hypothetical protein
MPPEHVPADFIFQGQRIPERMCGDIERYIRQGIEPGDFLRAVICNDLTEACGRADNENIRLLHVYVAYFYNEAPSGCWGSEQRYVAWIKRHAIERAAAQKRGKK